MENQNEQIQTNTAEESDAFLPDGWTGEGDFFEWAEQNMIPYYPLGVYKDVEIAQANADKLAMGGAAK